MTKSVCWKLFMNFKKRTKYSQLFSIVAGMYTIDFYIIINLINWTRTRKWAQEFVEVLIPKF